MMDLYVQVQKMKAVCLVNANHVQG